MNRAMAADLLAAELNAALPARRAALEFEQIYASPDQIERIKQSLFGLRIAESRLKSASGGGDIGAKVLGALAVSEAESLEAEAGFLLPLLGADAAGRRIGLLRLVCALLRLAQYGEGLARAHFTFARQGRQLGGYTSDALEWMPENELFFLALRRFEALLKAGKPWSIPDADWLRLRAATAPGRLRLRAAALRSGAELAADIALPADLVEKRQPYLDRGFVAATALGWAVTDFTPKQAFAWGEEGIADPAQAQAWRDRGLDPEEAGAWAAADLLPDEAAAFKSCGALDPGTAQQLRQQLGDVEYLLAWHRAGFEVAEVLRLRGQGVRSVEEALALRAAQPPAAVQPSFGRLTRGAELAPAPPPPLTPSAPVPSSFIPVSAPKPALVTTPPPDPQRWAQQRAWHCFGVQVDGFEAALAAAPPQGGVWLGWGLQTPRGSAEPGGSPEAYTLRLGPGLVTVAADSESVALPQQASRPSLVVGADWQARVEAQAPVLGPGGWNLFAWAPARAVLFWGLMSKTIAVPWGEAIDFDAAESWWQRWQRRRVEAGEPGAPCPCRLGRTLQGGWWVAVPASVISIAPGEPEAIEPLAFEVGWLATMEDFCLKMGMRFREPEWQLVAGREE